ncbi:MAG: DUF2339 domain-containing protein [Hyphomonadaceae bacterium]|nr:DUF2339 domain-containing protein [Hyphomonadaceae bacterium]
MNFAEFLVLGLILATAVGTGAAFGTFAFFRLQRYRAALIEQEVRIAALEARLGLAPAQDPVAAPAPVPAAPPRLQSVPPPPPAAAARAASLTQAPAPAAAVARAAPVTAPRPVNQNTPQPAVAAAARAEPRLRADPPPRPKPVPALAPEPLPTMASEKAPAAPVDMALVAWGAGIAITMGVIALLIAAYQGGYFNQLSQLLLGYVLAGAMIGGAEVLKRRHADAEPEALQADWQARHGPAILAAAGVICAFGITFAGYARLGLLPPAATLGLMGACALGGFGLALRHGRPLAWLGLAAGFGAPFLSGVIGASPTALFAYLFAITAAALSLTKHRRWLALGASAAVLAAGWAMAWTFVYFLPSGASAAAGYLVALLALGVAFAWEDASAPVNLAEDAVVRAPWPPRAWIGMALIAGAGFVMATLAIKGAGAGAPAVSALILSVAVLAVAAALREGFAPAPVVLSVLALAALATWPPILFAADARDFAGAAGALGLAASIGGWLMMARNAAPAPGALVAALVPAATLLIAYLRLGGAIEQPYAWGGLALVLAAFNGFALDRVSSAAGGAARAPGAATAFAAAAAACAVMAGAFAFDNVRMAAGVAVLLAPLAWLDRRLDIPALRFAGAAIGAVAVALLSPIALMRAEIETTPILNTLTPTFIIAIASVWAGARLFALGPAGYEARVTIFLRICLIALVIAFGFAEIRHLATRGDMAAPYVSLWEAGGHTSFLLAIACGIAWRFGRAKRPLLQWTEQVAFAVALVHALLVGIVLLAPWWGAAPASVDGPPAINSLLAAYAAPAALFALYGVLRARLGPSVRAHVAGAATLVTGLAWLVLAVRHGFHPFTMANAPVTAPEHAALSLALVGASGAILFVAMRFVGGVGGLMLRLAAATLTAAGVLKALIHDTGLIDGPARYGAYALLAGAGVAAVLAYHRYVFPRAGADEQPAREPDGDLIPPRP